MEQDLGKKNCSSLQINSKGLKTSINSMTGSSSEDSSNTACVNCRSSVSNRVPMTSSSDGSSSYSFGVSGLDTIRQRRMALTSEQIEEVQSLLTKIQIQVNEENWARKCSLRSKENSSESISEGARILSSIMERITSKTLDDEYFEEKTDEIGAIRAELEALAINADLMKPENYVKQGKIFGCIKRNRKITRQELLKEQSIEFVKKMTLVKNEITKKQVLLDDVTRRNDDLKQKCHDLEENLNKEVKAKESLESYVGRCEKLEKEVKSIEHEQMSNLIAERNGLIMLNEENRKQLSDIEICLGCEVDMRSKADAKLSVCKGENQILNNRINELKRQLENIKREQEAASKEKEAQEKVLEKSRSDYSLLQNELAAQKKKEEESAISFQDTIKEKMKMIGELTEEYHNDKRRQNQSLIEVSQELAKSQKQVTEIQHKMARLELDYSEEKQANKLETESLHKTLSDAHSRLESENSLIEHHKNVLEQVQKKLEHKDLECADLEEKNKSMQAVIDKLSSGKDRRQEVTAVLEGKLEKYKTNNGELQRKVESLKKENQDLLEVHVLEMADIKSKYVKAQEELDKFAVPKETVIKAIDSQEIGIQAQASEETPCIKLIDSSSQTSNANPVENKIGCDLSGTKEEQDCTNIVNSNNEELAIHAKAWQVMLQLQCNVFKLTAQGDLPMAEVQQSRRMSVSFATDEQEENPQNSDANISVNGSADIAEADIASKTEQDVTVSASDEDEWDFEVIPEQVPIKPKEVFTRNADIHSDSEESVSFSSDEFDWSIEDAPIHQKTDIAKQSSLLIETASPGTSKQTVFSDIGQVTNNASKHSMQNAEEIVPSAYAIKQGRSVRSTGDISFKIVGSTTSHPIEKTIDEDSSSDEACEEIVHLVDVDGDTDLSVPLQYEDENNGSAIDGKSEKRRMEERTNSHLEVEAVALQAELENIQCPLSVDTSTTMDDLQTVQRIDVKEAEMQTENISNQPGKQPTDVKEVGLQANLCNRPMEVQPVTANAETCINRKDMIDSKEMETQTEVDSNETDSREVALQTGVSITDVRAKIISSDEGTSTDFESSIQSIETLDTEMQTDAIALQYQEKFIETIDIGMQVAIENRMVEGKLTEQNDAIEMGCQTDMINVLPDNQTGVHQQMIDSAAQTPTERSSDIVQDQWVQGQCGDTSEIQLTAGPSHQSVTSSKTRKESLSILNTEVKSLRVSLDQALQDLNDQEQINSELEHQLATYNKEYLVEKSNAVIARRNECIQLRNELKLARDEILYLKTKLVADDSDQGTSETQEPEVETKGLDAKDKAIKYLQQKIQILRIKLFENDESMKIFNKDQADLEKKHNKLLEAFNKLEEEHDINLSTGSQLAKIIADQKRVIAEKEKELDEHEKCLQNAGRVIDSLTASALH